MVNPLQEKNVVCRLVYMYVDVETAREPFRVNSLDRSPLDDAINHKVLDAPLQVVLAYSGGLDTSVILKWLSGQGFEVIW